MAVLPTQRIAVGSPAVLARDGRILELLGEKDYISANGTHGDLVARDSELRSHALKRSRKFTQWVLKQLVRPRKTCKIGRHHVTLEIARL